MLEISDLGLDVQNLVECHHWKEFTAHVHHGAPASDGPDVLLGWLQRFGDEGQRNNEDLLSDRDRHAVQNRQSQGQPDRNAGAHTERRLDLHTPAHGMHVAFDHVHANTATRDRGDDIGGGKAGFEYQQPDLLVGHGVAHRQAALACLGHDLLAVQSGAVVAHFDDNVAALVEGAQRDRSGGWLARGQPLLRQLDAMVEAVANQMGERIGNLFYQALVELGAFAHGLEFDLLFELAGEVAHDAREAAEHERDRHHANRHHRLLQVARVVLELPQPGTQGLVQRSVHARRCLRQHGLRDDQLAHQIDELIDFFDADADRGGLVVGAVVGAALFNAGGVGGAASRRRFSC